jgi:hypothetical protein
VNILTAKTPAEAKSIVAGLLRPMAQDVMNGAVTNFSRGKNAKGALLKRPKRLQWGYDGGGNAQGVKAVLSSKAKYNIGGAGIDTATLFRHLSRREWAKIFAYGATIDPQIGVSGVRPDGIPLVSYMEIYRDTCAGGHLTGLNPKIKAVITRRLRSAL